MKSKIGQPFNLITVGTLLLLLVSIAQASADEFFGNLINLTKDNWGKFVEADKGSAWLVAFYSPHCTFSQDLSPIMMNSRNIVAAKRTSKGNGVKFGRVNLKNEHKLGFDFGITKTPTLLLFKPDGTVEEYLGLKEKRAI